MQNTCPLCAALLSDAWQDPLVSFQTRVDFRIVPLAKFPGSYAVQVRSKVDGVDGHWIHVPPYMPFNFAYCGEASAEEAIGHWLWSIDEDAEEMRYCGVCKRDTKEHVEHDGSISVGKCAVCGRFR